MKPRHAATLALLGVGAIAFFGCSTQNPLLGRWKVLPFQSIDDCGPATEIDFDEGSVTFIVLAQLRGGVEGPWPEKWPATYSHRGNRYVVNRPHSHPLVVLIYREGIAFCADDDCFKRCRLGRAAD